MYKPGVVVLVVVVVVLTLTRKIKSVVTGKAPVTLELRNTPGMYYWRVSYFERSWKARKSWKGSASIMEVGALRGQGWAIPEKDKIK